MIKINLNPYKKKKTKVSLPKIKIEQFGELVYFIPAAAVIILTITFTFYQSKIVNQLKSQKETLLTEKRKYKVVEQKINKLKNEYASLKIVLDKINIKKSIYKEFSKQKGDFTYYFKIIYNSMPDGIWLRSLYISRENIRLNGFSLNPLKISEFYKNLNNYSAKIKFKSIERKNNKLNSFYSFRFDATGLNKEGL